MKAIRVERFGGPEVLQLAEIPRPKPGAGEVLVKIHAIGVNPVDTYFRAGANPAITLPWIPGLDAAGVVEELGPGVTTLRPGQRVYTAGTVTGAYAEWTLCAPGQVYPLSDRLSFAQGAGVNVPYATAYRALFHRARVAAGETVLIHGASGGVGLAATQLARAFGLTVIGTAGTERGLDLVRREGAHHAVNHRAADYTKAILALTGGRGVEVILEMLANVNLGKDLPLLAEQGRVVVIGSRGPVEITPRDTMSRDADIRGMSLFNVKGRDLASIHAGLAAAIESGIVRPVIAREFPLAEAAAAHVAVMESGVGGKIVLIP
ncbi:MAG TPA: NADPH:quinone reductase [Methylomirabilota bacterium]|nr:NADPH:quinone reductase [Methylomirabilota bacterium]